MKNIVRHLCLRTTFRLVNDHIEEENVSITTWRNKKSKSRLKLMVRAALGKNTQFADADMNQVLEEILQGRPFQITSIPVDGSCDTEFLGGTRE